MVADDDFLITELAGSEPVNSALWREFNAVLGTDKVRGTHLFQGRYENLYVAADDVPSVRAVLTAARAEAAARVGCEPADLSAGFWFNLMQPGQVTLPHSHDDDDELLSGVYYVRVPPDSGNLILRLPAGTRSIEPKAGRFVFFSPRLVHEVGVNTSDAPRLSVGMNFGIRR